MRKQLLSTSALVGATVIAFSGMDLAYAQQKVEPIKISVGGFITQFVSYVDQDDVGSTAAGRSGKIVQFDQFSDQEIHFNGRTTLANGITVSFRIELEGNTDSTDQIDESWLAIEGKFGRFELGQLNNVHYRMGFQAPDVFTRGAISESTNVLATVVNPTGSPFTDSLIGTTRPRFFDNDSEKVNYYTPRFEGIQFGASYVPDSGQDRNVATPTSSAYTRGWAVGANFVRSFGGFDIKASAGYFTWQGPQTSATTSAPDPDVYSFGLRLGYAGFEIGGSYGRIKDGRSGSAGLGGSPSTAGTGANRVDGEGYDIGASYTTGPLAVSLTFHRGTNDDNPVASPSSDEDEFTQVALSGKYVLGPGISLEGVLFTGEFDGNSTTTPSNNSFSGLVAGVVLVF